ncbi:MAG: sigma-54-dependent Fis family transcriptional regulator [Gammaproteobacteria bacterium]|nr:sigma-54-dependent Fis family transcriptional regulator [Gammaproteobacteria bacterium]
MAAGPFRKDQPMIQPNFRALIVDDEDNFAESLAIALDDMFDVTIANSLVAARQILAEQTVAVLLLDVRLPEGNGVDYVHEFKVLQPNTIIVMLTAHATVENAIAALKQGAADYFTKPVNIPKLKQELNVLLENRQLHQQVRSLQRQIGSQAAAVFNASPLGAMKYIMEHVPLIAPLNIPVLITGETGTGKERLAQWIHTMSEQNGELVAINCAALPQDLVESELFGHVKGSFSGAVANKEGLIEKAAGGTLFLDEIAELSDNVQAKLLRLLESGAYFRVGDARERRISFRLIGATHKDLSNPANGFRADLFFRINGISFELPPLRERIQDLPLLVRLFIDEANRAYLKQITEIEAEALSALQRYNWPGNIRELKWVIHRAVAVAAGPLLTVKGLGTSPEIFRSRAAMPTGSAPSSDKAALSFRNEIATLEIQRIKAAMEATGGNKTEAAGALGISVRTLHYKLKKYGL